MTPHITRQELRAQHVAHVASEFLGQRPLVIGVAGVLLLAVLWWGAVPWQQATGVTLGFTVVWSGFFYERVRAARQNFTTTEFERSLLWTTCAITALSCATGGLFSPVLPIYIAPVVTTFAAFGRGEQALRMLTCMALMSVALGVATVYLPMLRIADPYRTGLLLSSLMTGVVLLYLSVTGMTRALDMSAHELDQLRLTSQRRTLRRAQDMEAMSARAAHELKNPLSTIKGLIQLEARQDAPPRKLKRYDIILQEIARSQSLINDHLTFARSMTDLSTRTHTLDELTGMLDALIDAQQYTGHPHRFTHTLSEPAQLIADLDKLRQALLNILSNAQQASQPTRPITLTASHTSDLLTLCITDEGCGMTPEELEQVGDPYYTSRTSEGTGLGALIARAIIVQHGGTLNYESEPDQGTTATITLPLDKEQP